VVDQVRWGGDGVVIEARGAAASAACPGCGNTSSRVHGRYQRTLADTALGGQPVVIQVQVRRFTCPDPGCARVTFAEQITGLTTPHARHSPPLRAALTSIAVALAGRAGVRLAAALGMTVGRDTLLNLLRKLPEPDVGQLDVLGVDDFALRRGHVYGTVMLDMRTHRPVDVLAGRDAEPLEAWLRAHPGVRIICRDRAGAYAEGARAGAPNATQVADRWHIWHNLGEAVDKTVAAHHACVRAALTVPTPTEPTPPATEPTEPSQTAEPRPEREPEQEGTLDACGRERRLVARTRQRYIDVQRLLAEGSSLSQICHTLELDRSTVRRFARATTIDELLVKAVNRTGVLDGFTAHLTERFAAGTTDAVALHAELQQLGYTGSVQTVRRYLNPLRQHRSAPAAPRRPQPQPDVPKPRRIVRWIMTDPRRLDSDDQAQLDTVLRCCPELDATARHVRDFADLMHTHHGDQLPDWMHRVEADHLPALHSLVTGLHRDLAAVIAGLTMTWSSGAVEGNVNRIKTIKRQMYGRAGFALLRKRILLTA
jgi:transposase